MFSAFLNIYGQTYSDKENTVSKVFDKIVETYAHMKSAPRWELLPNNQKERVVAEYTSDTHPRIRIDEQLVDICLKLEKDSLNALAIVISHELAHYYSDHLFCIDYAYAVGKKSPLSKELIKRNNSVANKFQNETEADTKGLWYAAAAGYYPFGIFEKLINKIYKEYKLADVLPGYPSKSERIQINDDWLLKAKKLLNVFEAGHILIQVGEYEEAAACFDEINTWFPSRENYNNAGAARLAEALYMKSQESVELIYPIELDPLSRLRDNSTRSLKDKNEKITALLLKARENFEAAKFQDRNYTKAYLNLACVLDLLGKRPLAIGELDDIPFTDTIQINKINLIKGIVYYHDDDTVKASLYFNKLPYGVDSIINYNLNKYRFKDQNITTSSTLYTNAWMQRNEQNATEIPDSLNILFEKFKTEINNFQDISSENKLKIRINKAQTGMEIYINEKKILTSIRRLNSNNTNELIIKPDNQWLKEKKWHKKWLVVQL